MTIAGVPVLKVQRKTGTTYWVEHGKYAVSANEPAVLEEILGRLAGKRLPPQLSPIPRPTKKPILFSVRGRLNFSCVSPI